jgi:hypothetical protein
VLGRLVDGKTHDLALGIVIDQHIVRQVVGFSSRLIAQVDGQRVRLGKIDDRHASPLPQMDTSARPADEEARDAGVADVGGAEAGEEAAVGALAP